jgi:hypothetical protein
MHNSYNRSEIILLHRLMMPVFFNKDEHKRLWSMRETFAMITAVYISALYFRQGSDTV